MAKSLTPDQFRFSMLKWSRDCEGLTATGHKHTFAIVKHYDEGYWLLVDDATWANRQYLFDKQWEAKVHAEEMNGNVITDRFLKVETC